MMLKNSKISLKYVKNFNITRTFFFNFLIYNLKKKNKIIEYDFKNYCIYTHRYRSVFRSFKMCRHQLKYFLDNNTFSNVFVK
jgi:hypothetical protein